LEALGDDHNAAVHGDDAVSSYREAISILRRTPDADEDRGRVCMVAARMILEKSGAFSSRQNPALIDDLVDEGRRCASDEGVLAWLRALWGAAAVWWLDAGVDTIAVDERIRSLRSVIGGVGADRFPEVAAFAREYLCELYMIRGEYGEVVEMTRRSERLERITSAPDRALLYVEAGIWTLQVAGEAERALELGMRSYGTAKDLSPHDLMHATGFVISVLYQLGRWSELASILEEHVAAFLEEPDSTCEMLRGGILAGATVSAHRGDLKAARDLESMAPPFVPTDPLWAGYADGWRARLQVAAGNPAAGRRQAETMFGSAQPWRRFHAGLVLVDALVALDDREALSRFLPEARALCGGMALLSPVCDRAEGASSAGSGEIAAARRSLSQAVDGFDRLEVPFEAARTRELLASVLPPTEARGQLEDAVSTYEAMGAEPHAARARALLGETEKASNRR
jgi:hypothetical protein